MSELQLTSSKQMLFNESVREQIDMWVAKYPASEAQSAVIPALHILQDAHAGWLSKEVMDALAVYLEMPAISVYEVATFYSMFELEPVGKNKISVCTNISCQLCGSDEIVTHLKQRLGISLGETTDDGLVTLKEVECLGACCGAPMLQLNRDYHENLTPDKIDNLLDGLS
jgi:NADH-quinone oxidoreductase subunit E